MLNPQEVLSQTHDNHLNMLSGRNNFAERGQQVGDNITTNYVGCNSENGPSFDKVEEDIDESVKEDMRKLAETFTGISERFRLINRIGEGMSALSGTLD